MSIINIINDDSLVVIDGDEETETSRFLTDVDEFRGTVDRSASSFFPNSSAFAIKSIGPLGWVLLSMTLLSALVVVSAPLTRRVRS